MIPAHSQDPNPAAGEQFRPRTSKILSFLLWGLALVIGATSAAAGVAGLPGIPLALAVAFVGYWLFWFPVVRLSETGVTLVNPARTVVVPWVALIAVDTKFALKLTTPSGAFTAWAAPAPGVTGTYRAKPEHVQNLPGTSYGAGGSMRPGDLRNSDSGAAAFLVRSRWAYLAESGQLDVDQTSTSRALVRWNVPQLIGAGIAAVAVVLVLLTLG
jgi:Bacterial PH domain